jgi:isochorismate synthase
MKKEMNTSDLRTLLEDRLRHENAFVTYRKPDSSTLVTWICDAPEVKSRFDVSEPGFVFSPFEPDRDAVLFPSPVSTVIRTPTQPSSWSPPAVVKELDAIDLEEARIRHIELVRRTVEEIRSGKAEKIVVSRKEEIRNVQLDPITVFMRLVSLYPQAYSYIWFHPEVGLWIGASPETLVEVEQRKFVTMSLAGTQRFHENEKVAWGAKELEEQRMVTDQIRKELGSMLDHVGVPFTQQAGHLLHLRTNIRGHLQEDNLLSDLISRLHPTAAICGLPREKALEFIQRNEGYSREYYSGFLGEVHYPVSGSAHLFVNLRCMRLFPDAKQAWVYVGGGITASSQPEKEWEETRAKSETMKRVFS